MEPSNPNPAPTFGIAPNWSDLSVGAGEKGVWAPDLFVDPAKLVAAKANPAAAGFETGCAVPVDPNKFFTAPGCGGVGTDGAPVIM